jgi:hypothetical protein
MKRSLWSSTLIGTVVGALLLPFAYGIMWLAPEESVIQSILYPIWYIVMFPAVFFPPPHGILMDAGIEIFWIVVGTLPGLTVWILARLGKAQRKT